MKNWLTRLIKQDKNIDFHDKQTTKKTNQHRRSRAVSYT